jgi:RNA polymerase sigma factor (sigma-70 family)
MNPDQSGHPGELTDNDLDQLLAAANEELLAHIKAAADPTSTLVAIMARTAPPAARPAEQEDYDGEFADFYRECAGKVLGFVLNMGVSRGDAEEVLNESFLVAWQHWHKFRLSNPQAYLYKVARNEVSKLRRMQSREPMDLTGDPSAPVTAESAVVTGDFTSQVADREMIRWALKELTEREREAVLFRYYVGCGVAEAATIMDITAGAVKRYAVDGLGKLRRALTGSGLRIRDEAQVETLVSCL